MSDCIKRNTNSKYASTSSLESVLILQGGGSLGAFGAVCLNHLQTMI